MTDETIFAPSTAPGRAGVAVIRISGPQSGAALRALAGDPLPEPRRAVLRRIMDPAAGSVIDHGLLLWFPGPASFTGEDLGELQLHGGRAVVAAALEALAGQPGLRPAEAGEFTRRAFDNGKLDLSAVEGLADLIDAETEAQRRQALRQMEGGLARRIGDWAARLTRVLAHFEAAIDFVEEELPEDLGAAALGEAEAVAAEIAAALDDRHRGERLREGLSAVILGAPNAGKSSLLNALARRDVAIVSETAGTTRDIVEVHLDLGGYPVTLADTAGLRALEKADEPQAAIERAGMARARERAERADIKLLLVDLDAALSDEAVLDGVAALHDSRSLVLLNKADLCAPEAVRGLGRRLGDWDPIAVSAKTGTGLDQVLERLVSLAGESFGGAEAAAAITRHRHRRALEDCLEALARGRSAELPELVAEELRLALRALGRVTGRVDVEDLLDIVFSDFCIGK
ncbi:tRNA uridine-5-carboxymethylaminomethyl(34) synthesis GTPase MnmE [Pelagibius sp. CAU 1746]|uniref:tRNA uridine-5-carboxymethylaminomethyl(34) synthesis GTPase MnmE n=1 Tax=Pelagibius sp. CAU 1746 TaxID=3140370 RepID=UPI00325C182B